MWKHLKRWVLQELEVKAKEQAEQYDEALQNAEAMKNVRAHVTYRVITVALTCVYPFQEILNLQKQLGDATNQLVQQVGFHAGAAQNLSIV